MSAAKRLIICGGSGFLGSRICKHAIARGWDVTSISHSGQPRWEAVTASCNSPPWSRDVAWERADMLRPAEYAPLLRGADCVVHSVGILLEADYKGIVSGRDSPLAGLRKVFAPTTGRGVSPLDKRPGEDIKPADARVQFSYEVMNRDSAVALARHAAEAGVGAFGYISACAGAPGMPPRYISTKREAERAIAANFPAMRGLFFRPPFMYDPSRKVTMGMAAMVGAGTLFNTLTGHYLNDLMGAAGTKPLRVDVVAQAVVEALGDDTVRGPIEVADIEELATKAWRKTML